MEVYQRCPREDTMQRLQSFTAESRICSIWCLPAIHPEPRVCTSTVFVVLGQNAETIR